MVRVSSGMAVVLVEYYWNAKSKAHIAERTYVATSTGHYFFSATAFEMIETKKMAKDKTFSLPVGFFY